MHYANTAIIALVVIIQVRGHEDLSSIVDVKSLSLLPLDALLNIRRNVINLKANKSAEDNISDPATSKESGPEALPFLGIKDAKKKADYYIHPDVEYSGYHEKKKGISQFFQLSVTYLAFLAFGGYLLFLILAAIKSKQPNNMYDPNVTQIMSAMLDVEHNKRKKRKKRKKKRPILGSGIFGYKQEEPLEKSHMVSRTLNEGPDIDRMYQALVNLCEGYTKIAGQEND